jgi:AcrR family transcriptional regulator
MSRQPGTFDRRQPHHGDRRRAALLAAMDQLLREAEYESVTIADIAARAGVTRSAFYFYFENKAACVAALGTEMYRETVAAADHLFTEAGEPRQRIHDMVESLFAVWENHVYLYRAVLEASRTSSAIRDNWDGYRETFVAPVAAMIDDERAAGRAPAGPDSETLATMLLELGDRTLERLDPGDRKGIRRRAEALAAVWLRSIYADSGEVAAASRTPPATRPRTRRRRA